MLTRRELLAVMGGTSLMTLPAMAQINGAGSHGALLETAGEIDPKIKTPIKDQVDWKQFLARHDLIWNAPATLWHEGAFIGNGLQGAMIYSGDNDALRWDTNRSDVVDRGHRLPIGQLVLVPEGKRTGGTMRLDLWNAEASGVLQTDRGTITWRSFTHATEGVTVVELQTSPQEQGARLEWRDLPAVDPRKVYQKTPIPEAELNPPLVVGKAGNTSFSTQKLENGAEYSTAWREVQLAPNHRLLFLNIGFVAPQTRDVVALNFVQTSQNQAVQAVDSAVAQGLNAFQDSHQAWWHDYFPASFISIPDTRLESFYWIQMYKLGSAMRTDGPALDLMGPWFRTTPWPKIWWNLNIQLTYWPVYASNRLELGKSLTNMLDAGVPNLINNVPEMFRTDSAGIGRSSSYDLSRPVDGVGGELGDLTWVMHNYWLQYRYSMDETMLRDRLFPLLKRSVNYYLHLLEKGDDGKLHLPLAFSPEYPTKAADTNYDLSLLRWGCQTLLRISDRLKLNDPLEPKWRETLQNLTPYPVDEQTGLMIGRDVPLSISHRHFSHMLMIYPLAIMNWEQPENRALIEKSLNHWIGFQGALKGYSYTGAASISAQMGRGNDAAKYLNQFLDSYVKPNTMYLEAGPVIETPLAATTSLHEMLLQSWGDKIRVFPAIPTAWRDVTFHNMRAEGAFLVSGVRRGGQTQWIRVSSLAGEPCRIKTDIVGPLQTMGERKFVLKSVEPGVFDIDLQRGETVILHPQGSNPDLVVAPVAAQPNMLNFYGSKALAKSPAA